MYYVGVEDSPLDEISETEEYDVEENEENKYISSR